MASKRPQLSAAWRLSNALQRQASRSPPVCPFCLLAPSKRPQTRIRRDPHRRRQSTIATTSNPRRELQRLLEELQEHASDLTNLSRLQLALHGLRQRSGQEVIRVAMLALGNGSSGNTAQAVLKALLSDPLQDQDAWGAELEGLDASAPFVVRVGQAGNEEQPSLTLAKEDATPSIRISSPEWNGNDLEILVLPKAADYLQPGGATVQSLEDALLVPTFDTVASSNHAAIAATLVHQTIVLADGLIGVGRIASVPFVEDEMGAISVVNIKGFPKQEPGVSFKVIDAELALEAIAKMRQGPEHAMEYERLWSASNMSALTTWLKAGVSSREDATKPAMRKLIASLLQSVLSRIRAEETRIISTGLAPEFPSSAASELNGALADWAQSAHAELQGVLDVVFTSRRWRKLGWWKLFWRVDDVAMLTNEMLSQSFLNTAERELVYLAGRIRELGGDLQYMQPKPAQEDSQKSTQSLSMPPDFLPKQTQQMKSALPKWPGHIAFTRRYLQNETVPALQALAQRLVAQSLGTTTATTSLAALLYISSFTAGIYEAGAVAALGAIFSLGRMQKKWETAREFWEGEVREEGRKAVRGAEESVAAALNGDKSGDALVEDQAKLEKVRELVAKAEDALARMK